MTAIVATRVMDVVDETNQIFTNFNLGAMSPVPDLSDGIVLAFVCYGDTSGVDSQPYITGGGLTWTHLDGGNNPDNLTNIWAAQGTGTATSADIIVHIGGFVATAVWVNIVQFENADTVEQYIFDTIDSSSGSQPLVLTFPSTPLNGGPPVVGHTTNVTTDRAMGIAVEVSDGGDDSYIMQLTQQEVSGSHTTPYPGGTLSVLDRNNGELTDTCLAHAGFNALAFSIHYWGILLKTSAVSDALGGADKNYRGDEDYRDPSTYRGD